MVRVTYGAPRRQKKTRLFKQARGFRGGRSKLWRTVRESLMRSWAYAYRDRQPEASASSADSGSSASTRPRRMRGVRPTRSFMAGLKQRRRST